MISGPQQSGNIRGSNPLIYTGSTPNMIIMNREPLPTDYIEYPIGQWWIIPIVGTFTTGEVWVLVSKANNLGTWKKLHGGGGPTPPGNTYLINKIYLTTPGAGTYTPTTGMKQCYVECIGGGGSGSTQITVNLAISVAGGAGAYCAKLLTDLQIGSSQSYTVGAGGIAPATASVGTNGGSTIFGTTPFLTAGGGTGGPLVTGQVGGGPYYVAGGTASGGDLNIPGGQGNMFFFGAQAGGSNIIYLSGGSGASFYSQPVVALQGNSSPFVCANGVNGSGGGGGYIFLSNPTATTKGGNGGNGMIIITEYLA